MRRRIREVLHVVSSNDRVAKWVNIALLLLISINVVASVLETDVEIANSMAGPLWGLELFSVVLFTIEFVLRVWTATEKDTWQAALFDRMRYLTRVLVLMDLVAILPFFLSLVLPGTFDLRFLRAMRMLRGFRLLRSGRIASAFTTLASVLKAKRADFLVALTILLVVLLLSASAIYFAEHRLPGSQFTSIPRSLWWAVVTVSTVGYGDMTPTSPIGQLVGTFVVFAGICVLALPVGIVTSGYMEELSKRTAQKNQSAQTCCNHCGLPLTTNKEEP